MGKDKFNPYNSSQYFNLPKSASEYDPSRTLQSPDIVGYLSAYGQMETDRIRREADEAMRSQQFYDSNGGVHSNWQDAIDANTGIELSKGLQPCQKGKATQTGNW
ncbi:MAG: hypothetical protein Q8M92_07045 [Candidatus Subteraquimicrobiales bacterium]|nr:hypothetical protein [Candidatus Subteraquimicrobiales bacterium]